MMQIRGTERDKNVELLEGYIRALLGQISLRDMVTDWDGGELMPAIRLILMTIKKGNDTQKRRKNQKTHLIR